jgi:hypothetical protein
MKKSKLAAAASAVLILSMQFACVHVFENKPDTTPPASESADDVVEHNSGTVKYTSEELGLTFEYPEEWEGKFEFVVGGSDTLGTVLDMFVVPRPVTTPELGRLGSIFKIDQDRWEREFIIGGELSFLMGGPLDILAEFETYKVVIAFPSDVQNDLSSHDTAMMISEDIASGKLVVAIQ